LYQNARCEKYKIMETLAHNTVATEIPVTSIFSYLRAATFGRQDLPPHSGGTGK
jgi:hypothetical protein